MNKLASNIRTIDSAEKQYARLQSNGSAKGDVQEALTTKSEEKAHIDLAAG